jgi:hypothetical protein
LKLNLRFAVAEIVLNEQVHFSKLGDYESLKWSILAMPYKWVRVQDERYSADSPNNRSVCEAGNVIDKE